MTKEQDHWSNSTVLVPCLEGAKAMRQGQAAEAIGLDLVRSLLSNESLGYLDASGERAVRSCAIEQKSDVGPAVVGWKATLLSLNLTRLD